MDKECNARSVWIWFTTLCILRKQQLVFSDTVFRLLGASDGDTGSFVNDLERLRIAQVRCWGSDRQSCVGLHDVPLESSLELARENGTLG